MTARDGASPVTSKPKLAIFGANAKVGAKGMVR
jgi:hypothetical protein